MSLKQSNIQSGWLTTKKRGRDDDRIEVDRGKAKENRRNRPGSRKKTTKPTTDKKITSKKKKTNGYDDDSFIAEEDDDDDNFSVHNETENDEEDEEEEIEEVLSDDETKNKIPSSRGDMQSQSNRFAKADFDNSSSDDDNVQTFFQNHKPRTSIPPPKILQVSNRSRKVITSKKSNIISAAATKNPFGKINGTSASSEGQKQQSSTTHASRIRPFGSVQSSNKPDDYNSYDDESVLFKNELDTKKTAKTPSNKSKLWPVVDNDLEDTPELSARTTLANTKTTGLKKIKKPLVEYYSDDSDDDNHTNQKTKSQSNKFAVFAAPNSKISQQTKNKPLNSSSAISISDCCEDEDEATALAWALKDSIEMASDVTEQKQNGKSSGSFMSKKKPGKKPIQESGVAYKKKKKTQNLIKTYKMDLELQEEDEELSESLDVNNSDGEGDNDSYVDKDAEAASSILETANILSAQVLHNMIRWTKQNCSESEALQQSKSTSTIGGALMTSNVEIPMGMIVDGALALSSLSGGYMNSNEAAVVTDDNSLINTFHSNGDCEELSWISNELMQQILPDVKLADYQLIGVNWMALLHHMKCELVDGSVNKKDASNASSRRKDAIKTTNVNGILADEMGLGKTVQTIAFLCWLKYVNTNGKVNEDDPLLPHLIVAPASVISNWENEIHKFAPNMKIVKYHGSMQERQEMQREMMLCIPTRSNTEGSHNSNGNEQVDIVLASVTYFQKEQSDDRSFLRRFRYEYLVVDEAHLLKNSRGTRYKSLDKMISNHRLLLTGTPVQNSPKELMSLLCFLMPLFSRKTNSEDDFDGNGGHDGGEGMLQHFVSIEGKGTSDSENYQSAYRKLKQLFSPFVLRRRKQDVLNQILPPKERRVELVQLDDEARKQYDSIIEEHVEAKKAGKKLNFENLFTQLRKAAHHPLLVRYRHRSPSEKEHLVNWFHQYGAFRGEANTKKRVADELEKYSDFEIHLTAHDLVTENPHRRAEIGRYLLSEDDLFRSAKFELLRTILPDLIRTKGHRVLIFSGWTTVLDLLTCLMDSLDLRYMRMDGQTDVSERQSLIDSFNNDPSIPVFLLSTRASGLGITLTSAQVCIIHDLDFNPFNDLQAEDRCHRIGQKEKVTVIKLVTADTVDQDVYAMQERKSRMNSAIMDNNSTVQEEWNAKEAKMQKDRIIETTMNRFIQKKHQQQSQTQGVDSAQGEVKPSTDVIIPSSTESATIATDTI